MSHFPGRAGSGLAGLLDANVFAWFGLVGGSAIPGQAGSAERSGAEGPSSHWPHLAGRRHGLVGPLLGAK